MLETTLGQTHIHDEDTRFCHPDCDALHLFDDEDHFAAILAVFNVLSCERAEIKSRLEEVGVDIGGDVESDDENCVSGHSDPHQPIIGLKILDRALVKNAGCADTCYKTEP